MSATCTGFSSFVTGSPVDGEYAAISETWDAPAGTTTPYSMTVGDTFSGTLSVAGDRDWVAITLSAGQSIAIDLLGSPSGLGTLSDPYLRVYNSNGVQIAFNDDGGLGYESSLNFVASGSGTYYLAAGSFYDYYAGSYQLRVTAGAPPPTPGTLDELADYLTDGYWQDNGTSGRSFDTSASNRITVNISALTGEGQQLARWAFEVWESVADIRFTETGGSAMISFEDNQSGAFSTSAVSFGSIISSFVNVSTGWLASYGTTIDSYSLQTYVHEIGHALGLGHQGAYNGSASYGVDAIFANDSWQMSVMSYFDQVENTATNATLAFLASTMMADIVAIQNLYGVPGAGGQTDGNTTWGANSNLGGYFGQLFSALNGGPAAGIYSGDDIAFTIYDQGGIDTIDTSGSGTNDRISLTGGSFSNLSGGIGNLGIARGTVIEHAIAGSGHDTLIGNAADNRLTGNAGNDRLQGGAGNDSLIGGAGNDVAVFGVASTSILVTLGVSGLFINSTAGLDFLANDVERAEFSDTTRSYDQLNAMAGPGPTAGADTLTGTAGADNISGLGGNDSIQGLAGNDTVWAGTGNDTVSGGAGDDDISGGDGHDHLWGGAGDDTIFGATGDDRISGEDGTDQLWGGAGNDSVWAGGGNDTVFGNENNDNITGGDGIDDLWGGSGDDTIFAGNGNDRLSGITGNDELWGGNGDDQIFGAAGNDTLYGLADDDDLWGGDGLDLLNGGAGNDTLRGGAGDDTFVFSGGLDRVIGFDAGNTEDRVDLSGVGAIAGLADLLDPNSGHLTLVGGNAVISDGAGNTMTLVGVGLGGLDAGDFIF